jgi:hypothetical protein
MSATNGTEPAALDLVMVAQAVVALHDGFQTMSRNVDERIKQLERRAPLSAAAGTGSVTIIQPPQQAIRILRDATGTITGSEPIPPGDAA